MIAQDDTRILVVEDDAHLRRDVSRLLQQAGYAVLEASTGQAALDQVRQQAPGLVLLDVVLPDVDGLEVCRRIKADPATAGVYVLLLSGVRTSSDDQAVGLEAGADGYVVRPVANRELLARVGALARLKRAEDALRASEERFRGIVEQSQDGITLTDETGVVVEWNPAMERITGLPAEDVLGRTIWDVQFQLGFEEQKTPEFYRQLETSIRALLSSGQAPWLGQLLEREYRRPDGTSRFVQGTVFPIQTDQGFMLGSVSRDVTEYKMAEAALQERVKELRCLYGISALVERPDISLPEIMQETVDLIPPAWQYPAITGARIILDDREFRTANFQETAWCQDRDITVRGAPAGCVQVCYLEERPAEDEGPFLREERDLINAIAERVGRIVERVQAEEQLARQAEDLAHSNAELARFAYVASHHLQEPLRAVTAHTQLLAQRYQGQLDADADEIIAHVVDGAAYMKQLINDLLAYTQVDRRGQEFAPTNCETVLERVLQGLAPIILERGATVTHDPLPTVWADRIQLGQVFQHLVENAVKFQEADLPWVHISAAREGDAWVFSVRDNGIGIDPAYHEHVFEVFQRLHTRDEYPGTGVGLALCKKIVERHGGRIWVDSQVGQGSTFHVALPIHAGSAVESTRTPL